MFRGYNLVSAISSVMVSPCWVSVFFVEYGLCFLGLVWVGFLWRDLDSASVASPCVGLRQEKAS